MDITRNRWFNSLVAIASALGIGALMTQVGLFGAGHYSIIAFTIFALAVFGLDRLLGGILGMIWVLVVPHEKFAALPKY